jgi:hypothetical protein
MYNFHGIYRYHPKLASNWRAVTAFFIGCIPPLPGFVNNIVVAGGQTTGVSLGGQHLYVYMPCLSAFLLCCHSDLLTAFLLIPSLPPSSFFSSLLLVPSPRPFSSSV